MLVFVRSVVKEARVDGNCTFVLQTMLLIKPQEAAKNQGEKRRIRSTPYRLLVSCAASTCQDLRKGLPQTGVIKAPILHKVWRALIFVRIKGNKGIKTCSKRGMTMIKLSSTHSPSRFQVVLILTSSQLHKVIECFKFCG